VSLFVLPFLPQPHVFLPKQSSVTTFRINTCESVTKQATLSTLRMNTYAKPRGRGQLTLTKSRDSRALSSSKVRSLFCTFLHCAHQERFTTPLESASSTLFSKTAGCHPIRRKHFSPLVTCPVTSHFDCASFSEPSNLPTFKRSNVLSRVC
jgi:hypothetical protein